MIKINLLPVRAAKKKETMRQQISIAVLSLSMVLIVIGYLEISLRGEIARTKATIASTEEEIKRTKEVIGEVSKFKEAKKVLEDKLGVIATLKKGKTLPIKTLEDLSRVTPEKLWLNSYKEASGRVAIDGIAVGNDVIAQFMTDLEGSPYFKDIELGVTEQVEHGKEKLKLKKFNLTGNIEGLMPVTTKKKK